MAHTDLGLEVQKKFAAACRKPLWKAAQTGGPEHADVLCPAPALNKIMRNYKMPKIKHIPVRKTLFKLTKNGKV